MRKLKNSGRMEAGGQRVALGVLAFEVAGLMSRTAHLWHALADAQVARLRREVLHLEGVRKLVSDDGDALLSLALGEMAHSLRGLSRSVARLSCRCSDPLLQQFDRLFTDFVKVGADLHGLRYAAAKKMERKVRKMERLVGATANLYQELEVLAELEQALRRAQAADAAGAGETGHKVLWQRQEVKYLRAASLWNRSFDYTVRLLARSLFTIVARIRLVFGLETNDNDAADVSHSGGGGDARAVGRLSHSHSIVGLTQSSVHPSDCATAITPRFASGPLMRPSAKSGPIGNGGSHCFPPSKSQNLKLKWPVTSRPFKGCMVGGSKSPVLESCIQLDNGHTPRFSTMVAGADDLGADFRGNCMNEKLAMFVLESSHNVVMNAPESTLGAAALALHYANLIILIEKLAVSPHLISPDARDDLYSMLTARIRASLRARLKSYAKNLASSVYDPVLMAEWTDAIQRILGWLAPLAHNMIRWQSERNVEQQHVVASTNVLLMQTLHFANQKKTEAAITELLVGLNYLWRSGRKLNAKAISECAGSGNYDHCLDSIG